MAPAHAPGKNFAAMINSATQSRLTRRRR